MSMNSHSHYQDWELFALGALEEDEQREMAEHLATGCEECRRVYSSAESLVATLGTTSPEADWPAGAEARMRQRLTGTAVLPAEPGPMPTPVKRPGLRLVPPQKTSRTVSVLPWLLAAAALLVAAALELSRIDLTRTFEQRLDQQKQQAAAELGQLQKSLDAASHPAAPTPAPATPDPALAALKLANAKHQENLHQLEAQLRAAMASKQKAEQALAAAQSASQSASERLAALETRANQAEAQRAQLEAALAKAQQQLAQAEDARLRLQVVSADRDRIVGLLESASLSQLPLKPVGDSKASARVFWKNDRGLLLVASNLPVTPEHASYQLWFYRHGRSDLVPVGSVKVDSNGSGILFVPPGDALLAMTGALVTRQSPADPTGQAGVSVLQAKP